MNKTLLRRLLFELFEDLVLLEAQVQGLEHITPDNTLPYLQILEEKVSQAKLSLLESREDFLQLFQESPLEDTLVGNLLNQVFPGVRAQIDPICKAVYRLKGGQILPETELFLSSLQLDKLLPDVSELVVLPAQTTEDKDPDSFSESFLVSYLPILSSETPLRWVGLVDSFSNCFCAKTLQLQSLMESLRVPGSKTEILTPLLNLRMLGPSYYAHYVLNAFQTMDATALWVVEPILFQELNRFGLVNKDLVILHQSLEKGRQQPTLEEPKTLTRLLSNDETRDELLKVIEKVIPERLAFTEKSLLRTQLIEERLEQGTLISAVPMLSSPAQLRDDLNHLDEEHSIYALLQQMEETPATPREIVNAGWLHKLDQSSTWLFNLLNDDVTESWEPFKQTILDLDTLLLKSIEISEVHRVLSHENTEHLVSV
jgi:hypothetical protein